MLDYISELPTDTDNVDENHSNIQFHEHDRNKIANMFW
jgi:hypothetical protein